MYKGGSSGMSVGFTKSMWRGQLSAARLFIKHTLEKLYKLLVKKKPSTLMKRHP